MSRWRWAALHALLVAGVFCFSPVATSGDSRWTVPVALNLLEHGRTNVLAGQPGGGLERAPDGLTYATYPVWVAVIAAPFLPPIRALALTANALFHPRFRSPMLQAFFAGDLAGAYGLVEMLIASVLMAVAAGVQFLLASEFLSWARASLLTLIFAFATPVWSTASRAMWNHTPALLALLIAIYLLVRKRAALTAIPLSVAFMMRPTLAVAVAVLTGYVFFHRRESFARFVLYALPFVILFFGYNLSTRGHWFQSYFTEPGAWPYAPWPERFALQLISPSRGLLIFCPLVLFSIAGMAAAWRSRWLYPLSRYLIAIVVVQVFLIAKFYWPGYCYGPRYYTETIPIFTLFLVPVLGRARPVNALFVLALAWSVFVQFRGGTDFTVHRWNGEPDDLNRHPSRVWDWRDPQWLRGLH